MRTFTVNGETYAVEFRHIKPGRGMAQQWRVYIQASTTVVVMQLSKHQSLAPEMVAIETVMCVFPDKFSRREGRLRAVAKLAERCGKIRPFKLEFLLAYASVDPEIINTASIKRPKLPADERKNRYEKGFEVRARRANERAARA